MTERDTGREDQAWTGQVRKYDGVLLLVITVVILIGAVIMWMDRRDNVQMFRLMGESISTLAVEARGTREILSRVEKTVDMLSKQNARWLSIERQLDELQERVQRAESRQ